jgi:hypothetical protein
MHVDLFGYLPTDEISFRQRVLRPIKRAVVGLGLMPRSMKGKQLLKRLVFGRPVVMPAEVSRGAEELAPMTPLDARVADTRHKVIYAVASLA